MDEARAANAKPVLITSLTRRRFGKDDRVDSDLFAYANAVKRVAAEKRVPLIDLHALSIALVNELGRAKSDELGKMKPDGKGGPSTIARGHFKAMRMRICFLIAPPAFVFP